MKDCAFKVGDKIRRRDWDKDQYVTVERLSYLRKPEGIFVDTIQCKRPHSDEGHVFMNEASHLYEFWAESECKNTTSKSILTLEQKEILWLQIGRLEGMSLAIGSFKVDQIDKDSLAQLLTDIADTLEDTFFPEANK